MNFDQALFEYSLLADEELKKTANIIIRYNSKKKGKGFAELKAPKYYKDKSNTMATVKRAWECFCNGSEEILYSIENISIEYKEESGGSKDKQNNRIPA